MHLSTVTHDVVINTFIECRVSDHKMYHCCPLGVFQGVIITEVIVRAGLNQYDPVVVSTVDDLESKVRHLSPLIKFSLHCRLF